MILVQIWYGRLYLYVMNNAILLERKQVLDLYEHMTFDVVII